MTTTQPQTQYAIKDDNATSPLVNPRNTLVNQTLSNNPDGTATRLTSGNAVNFYTGRGWYVDFPDSGGRVNIDSKLVEGTLRAPPSFLRILSARRAGMAGSTSSTTRQAAPSIRQPTWLH